MLCGGLSWNTSCRRPSNAPSENFLSPWLYDFLSNFLFDLFRDLFMNKNILSHFVEECKHVSTFSEHSFVNNFLFGKFVQWCRFVFHKFIDNRHHHHHPTQKKSDMGNFQVFGWHKMCNVSTFLSSQFLSTYSKHPERWCNVYLWSLLTGMRVTLLYLSPLPTHHMLHSHHLKYSFYLIILHNIHVRPAS